MTETSYHPPAASSRQRGGTGTPGPVLVAVGGPSAQRRAAVAVRFILTVPHLLALSFLAIAACVVVVIGWLGALVTGRLPRFAATYLSGYLGWYSRVGAYLLLLTDEYPPFAFGDDAYPVRLAVGSGKLNRLTVAFRIILALPAAIALILLTLGCTTLVLFIAWLTALIVGRLPASLHQAFTAVLRYAVRYYGYLYLLTGAYPAGLFGDEPGAQTQAVAAPAAGLGYGTAAPGPAAPSPGGGSPAAGYGPRAADYAAPGYGASGYGTPGYATPWQSAGPAPEAAASGEAASWPLVLSPGAKRLVGLILVLGLLTAAGAGAGVVAKINAVRQRDREISQLNAAVARFNAAVTRHNAAVVREQEAVIPVTAATTVLTNANDTFNGVLNGPSTDSSNCSSVYCFNMTSLPIANAAAAFGRVLHATKIPAGSAVIAKRLAVDNAAYEQDWRESATADSLTSLVNLSTAAETVGAHWDTDFAALMTSLNNESGALGNEAVTLNNAATSLNQEGAALSRRAAALNVTVSVRAAANGTP
jgi:hypothetical protein